MSNQPINLDAFWRATYSERTLVLKHLAFIHEKRTSLEKEKLNLITAHQAASPVISAPVSTPTKTSNANPPLPPRKPKQTARKTSPSSNTQDSDYEVVIHKVTFDSDDEDAEDGFIIHKKKRTTPSLNLNEK